ncbi:uncharacterized protein LOC114938838 isoform X1 [Nylanderia fulva]|uniref:uncharacterized protein LOC114938838 isoform X1 n=1 Tax=Nylanderia fulva TaxID=613905 RepID=UPI0010FB76E0|nr:uncharacterized protein LOC114938838 isoform X1 [Nylanderia fulva]
MNNPDRENNPPEPKIVDAANPTEPYYNILKDIDISMVYNSEEEDVMSDMDIKEELNSSLTLTASSDYEEELNSSSTLTASSVCEEEQQEEPLVIKPSIPATSVIFLDNLDIMRNVEVETSGNLDEPKNIDGPDHPSN